MMGVISHLEPNTLECEIKWTLGSITIIKASGADGIPAEFFQILKDNSGKGLHSICQLIWKTQQWPQDWKKSVFTPIPKKGNAKECSKYHTIPLISHPSHVILQALQKNAWICLFSHVPDDDHHTTLNHFPNTPFLRVTEGQGPLWCWSIVEQDKEWSLIDSWLLWMGPSEAPSKAELHLLPRNRVGWNEAHQWLTA